MQYRTAGQTAIDIIPTFRFDCEYLGPKELFIVYTCRNMGGYRVFWRSVVIEFSMALGTWVIEISVDSFITLSSCAP